MYEDTKKWLLVTFAATLPMLLSFFIHAANAADNQPAQVSAADPSQVSAQHPTMKEHQGSGDLQRGEYEIIDLSGSVTRSFCPYTCADRGLAPANCKAWKSIQDPDKCYVRDTRLPSNAFQ